MAVDVRRGPVRRDAPSSDLRPETGTGWADPLLVRLPFTPPLRRDLGPDTDPQAARAVLPLWGILDHPAPRRSDDL